MENKHGAAPPEGADARVVSRRMMLKALGGAAALVAIPGALLGGDNEPPRHQAYPGVDAELEEQLHRDVSGEMHQEAAHALEQAEHSEEDPEKPSVLDWIGTINFGLGIRDVVKGGHIDQTRYGTSGALIFIKREDRRLAGDDEAVKHIDEEIATTVKFTAAIEGIVMGAEGVQLDLESIYRHLRGREMEQSDRVASTLILASGMSMGITTIGTSGTLSPQMKKIVAEARELQGQMVDGTVQSTAPEGADTDAVSRVKGNMQMMVSNIAGFGGIGDLPFIATVEKYGAKGLAWQTLSLGLVPPAYSLLRYNYSTQKQLLELQGYEGKELRAKAMRDSFSSLLRSAPLAAYVFGRSLENAGRALAPGLRQHDKGAQFQLISSFKAALQGAYSLLMKDDKDLKDLDEHGHLTEDYSGYEAFLANVIEEASAGNSEEGRAGETTVEDDSRTINDFVDAGNYEGLGEWMRAKGMDSWLVNILAASARNVENVKAEQRGNKWNPMHVYRRVTSLDRQKAALGHSKTDVLNVFPFQSLSTIFASPVFKYGANLLETGIGRLDIPNALKGVLRRGTLYGATGVGSSYLDNLVAARESLKVMPDDPAHSLVAAMNAGGAFPWANMANVAGMSLSEYSPKEAARQIPGHLPIFGVNFLWAELLSLANRSGVLKFPEPSEKSVAEH